MQLMQRLGMSKRKHCRRTANEAVVHACKAPTPSSPPPSPEPYPAPRPAPSHVQAMKKRLGSKTSTGIFFMERPFFDVDVELKVPSVVMNPTLADIQAAINECAKKVLTTSKRLPAWGMDSVATTYHELIAQDKEVVKAILRLTGE